MTDQSADAADATTVRMRTGEPSSDQLVSADFDLAGAPDPTEISKAKDMPVGAVARAGDHEHGGDGNNDQDGDVDKDVKEDEDDGDEDEDEVDSSEDEEDEEPRLKYVRLTPYLGPVYRNGDATSTFLASGDKMIIGTHSGNIHVIQLPIFHPLRVYHAHSASVTSLSISPFPPPLGGAATATAAHLAASPPSSSRTPTAATGSSRAPSVATSDSASPAKAAAAAARRGREQPTSVPNVPSNNIYIATSSTDGNVCVQSLIDPLDVQLRSFARPVQAVALSPDYKNDRTYLSGGLAGHLVLTVGGERGKSVSTTVGTAAATASGWLGIMGLGSNTGKDTILHSGEGPISAIRWSLSGRYIVWLNETGIKIMRSKLHLDAHDSDDAWRRIGHIDRPQTDEWEAMASVWKGRVEWIDESAVATDDSDQGRRDIVPASPAAARLRSQAAASQPERLLVGWGGTLWIIHIHAGGIGTGNNAGEKIPARAEIVKVLRMDCIISGLSLYTHNLLLVLAYCRPEDGSDSEPEPEPEPDGTKAAKKNAKSKLQPATGVDISPSGGIRRRSNNQPPELRLIDLTSQAEVDKDGLSVSRHERLHAADYHLAVLPAPTASAVVSQRGALEALAGLGTDVWNAAINPRSLFNSGASIRSGRSGGGGGGGGGDAGSVSRFGGTIGPAARKPFPASVHPNLVKPSIKIFVHSPYDCIVATKRDLADHLGWLIEQQRYQAGWELLDENPDILSSPPDLPMATPTTPTPPKAAATSKLAKTEAEAAIAGASADSQTDASSTVASPSRSQFTAVEKEKRRISELWLSELVGAGKWSEAGQVCGRVLATPDRWEKWVWAFVGAKRFDEIADQMPVMATRPPIPKTMYEVVLGHYLQSDKLKFRALLGRWAGADLFDAATVATALENQLAYRDVREDSVEGGVRGRDWGIVMESLARLYEASGRHRDALRCFIRLHDADAAFRLIRDRHLADAVTDDIPSFITLRVPPGKHLSMTQPELEEATDEAVTLLVDEAQHGLVRPGVVVSQLLSKGLSLYLFFYLRALFRGEGIREHAGETRDRLVLESKTLVDEFADLAVTLFAKHDRGLLMEFLQSSTSYTFDKAVQECETYRYDDELVHLYSKTGQTKRALYLIIERLRDVPKAIAFARAQDDPDLWADLLDYSMDKPPFIRALLEQVQYGSSALDPVGLVRRIPEGLEIQGLREGIRHIIKEHEIQRSISEGVACVLRSEVGGWQAKLRSGQRRGIRFEVLEEESVPKSGGRKKTTTGAEVREESLKGQCAECGARFTVEEAVDPAQTRPLVGFACGHVFHLDHLLEALGRAEAAGGGGDGRGSGRWRNRGRGADIDLVGPEGGGGDRSGGGYRVGSKVTHARLLRDRIRGGCPACAEKGGAGHGGIVGDFLSI